MSVTSRQMRVPSVLVLLVAVFATLVATPGAAHATIDSTAESQFVSLINASRADNGLPALRVASDLRDVARAHSKVMSAQNKLHHNPDLAEDVDNWYVLAENVGYGSTVDSLHDAFMESTGHRANILNTKVTEIGVGVDVVAGRIWVTEIFRKPKVTTTTTTAAGDSAKGGVPLWGDWDGDGVATPGRFKDGLFTFNSRRDGTGTNWTLQYGKAGDKPVVGDWDGDGVDTVGVVRGNLFILRNEYRKDAEDIVLAYGRSSDKPVVGDWDGDGKDTIGVVRGNLWILRNEYKRGAEDILMYYGWSSDTPVTGDWDGNGTDTLGVVRGNLWILRNEYKRGAEDILMNYGWSSDAKVTGDYNSDGRDTLGIVRGDLWVLRSEYVSGAKDLKFTY